MDGAAIEFWLKALGAITALLSVIGILLAYIWNEHRKDVADQKKELIALKGAAATSTELVRLEERFDRKVETIERRHRDEVEALRRDMNGMSERLSRAIEVSQSNISEQVDALGKSFTAQVGLLVKLVEGLKLGGGDHS